MHTESLLQPGCVHRAQLVVGNLSMLAVFHRLSMRVQQSMQSESVPESSLVSRCLRLWTGAKTQVSLLARFHGYILRHVYRAAVYAIYVQQRRHVLDRQRRRAVFLLSLLHW